MPLGSGNQDLAFVWPFWQRGVSGALGNGSADLAVALGKFGGRLLHLIEISEGERPDTTGCPTDSSASASSTMRNERSTKSRPS